MIKAAVKDEAIFEAALPHDAEVMASIDAGSPRPWDVKTFLGELENNPPTLFVLRRGEVIGFVVIRVLDDQMDIVNLAVAPRSRRQGLGRRLLRAVLEHARSTGVKTVFLEVREGNQGARKLYATLGFEETQRRRGFYREPAEDALLLRLDLR